MADWIDVVATNYLGVIAVILAALWPQVFVVQGRPVARGAVTSGPESPWLWPAVLLVVVGAVARLVRSPLLAVISPILGVVGWRELARHRSRTRRRNRMLLTSRFVEEMAAAVRGGRSLAASVLVACEACDGAGNGRAPTPSNHDGKNRDADVVVWREVAARIGAGRSLRGAIDDVFRVGQPLSSDERLILSTIVALDTTGSPAIDAVERVGDALRERAASHEDARTHAQQAFSSAAVLSALPAVFGLAAALAEPDLAALYTQRWIGALCVGVAVGLTVAGWEWLQYLLGGRR